MLMINVILQLISHRSDWRHELRTCVDSPAAWGGSSASEGIGKLSTFSTIVVLTAGFLTGGLAVQASSQSDEDAPAQWPTTASDDTRSIPESQLSTNMKRPEEYTPSLDGGLIAMRQARITHLMVGATGSFALGSDPEDLNISSAPSSGTSILSPYVGITASTVRTQIVAQYEATLTRYTSAGYAPQTIHFGSLRLASDLSPRLNIDGKLSGSYGQDSVRFLGPQQSVDVGGVAGVGAGSATYLPNAGMSTNLDGSMGLHYKESERETLSIGITDNFSRYSGLTGTNSVVLTTAGYDRGVSPRLSILAYGQGAYYYGTVECAGVGGGAGFKWQFREGSSVSLSGGPLIDSSACKSQQGFSFNTAGALRITGKSQVYVLASRQPSVSYLGGGLWQTSVSGGYQRQLGPKATLSFDVSHITSSDFANAGAYSGSYFAAAINRRLGHGIGTTLTYRSYQGSSGNSSATNSSGNIVMFSLMWTPDAGHILQ
jgi:hypothetical protein